VLIVFYVCGCPPGEIKIFITIALNYSRIPFYVSKFARISTGAEYDWSMTTKIRSCVGVELKV